MKSLTELKAIQKKALDLLYTMEDSTNYEVKSISLGINLLQDLDLDKEYKKYNRLTRQKRRNIR